MFNAISLFAAVALAAPSVQMAQAQTTPRPAQQGQQAQQPRQMTKADFARSVDARFTALDANKDGSIDKAEMTAAQSRILQQAATAQQQRLEAEFQKLDTNKDNQLSLAEFKAAAQPVRASQTPDQMLAQLDTNKDGKVSAQEYRAAPLASFDRADTNKDGIVTAAELQAARASNR